MKNKTEPQSGGESRQANLSGAEIVVGQPADKSGKEKKAGPGGNVVPELAHGGLENMEWQPIETAPRDGTTILITFKRIDGKWLIQAGFFKERSDGSVGWALYQVGRHWWSISNFEATHWMPLPDPPTE